MISDPPEVQETAVPLEDDELLEVAAAAQAIFPILFAVALFSVNQIFPSGPAVMPYGLLLAVGIENSVTTPLGVILPILSTG